MELTELPEEVRRAREHLFGQRVHFAPIRHHSPACAWALRAMLHAVRPAAVLIEGPDNCNTLIPLLLDAQTRPPVAILCQATRKRKATPVSNLSPSASDDGSDGKGGGGGGGGNDSGTDNDADDDDTRSAFFPFCDYSPEWVALREGQALGAQLAFIDLDWSSKAWAKDVDTLAGEEDDGDGNTAGILGKTNAATGDEADAASLMAERYLAHSRYLSRLADKTGCRDHHELWDRWFELRSPQATADWRAFFGDVFAYCAMARLDYEPAVLEAEGSLPRERHMAAAIESWCRQVDGPIVVVTGGFHTLALVEALLPSTRYAASATRPAKAAKTGGLTKPAGSSSATRARPTPAAAAPQNWLIRYSFDRLDALNGYGAGMPSPMYYQRSWNALQQGATEQQRTQVAIDCLTGIARQQRDNGAADAISTADVLAASVQASRLAQLRGNQGPGRHDLLDAMRSCFVKGAIDDGTSGIHADIAHFLRGSLIGDIPPSAGSPPLLEDARRAAREHGVRLDDSDARTARLDLYRKPGHRERSRFFHLMAYLQTGLAQWIAGPDFAAGARLDLMIEEWRVAWTPLVEARLITLSTEGASLSSVAMARLHREERALADEGQSRSASRVVSLMTRACLIGMQQRLSDLIRLVDVHLDEDASFASVVDCGHRLASLWRAREPLGVQQHPALLALMCRVWPAALYLLPELARVGDDAENAAISQLLSLREFGAVLKSAVAAPGQDTGINARVNAKADSTPHHPMLLQPLRDALLHLTDDPECGAGLCGAASALLFIDGSWDEEQLIHLLHERFGVGATPHESVRFLNGMMSAAPELLLRIPDLLDGFNTVIASWDETSFVAHLPDLRDAFTRLKPQETASLADSLLDLNGGGEIQGLDTTSYLVSQTDMLQGSRLQVALTETLRRDALAGWS